MWQNNNINLLSLHGYTATTTTAPYNNKLIFLLINKTNTYSLFKYLKITTYSTFVVSSNMTFYMQLWYTNNITTITAPNSTLIINKIGNIAMRTLSTNTLGWTLINTCIID